jgi:hypothetical protein
MIVTIEINDSTAFLSKTDTFNSMRLVVITEPVWIDRSGHHYRKNKKTKQNEEGILETSMDYDASLSQIYGEIV